MGLVQIGLLVNCFGNRRDVGCQLPTVINESAFCAVMESLSGGIAQCGVSKQSNHPFELVSA